MATNILEQVNTIKKALESFPNGANIEELIIASGLPLELRTFQRRLAYLKQSGEVTVSGDTRSTRYHLSEKPAFLILQEPQVLLGHNEYGIPLSDAAKNIIGKIKLPVQMRKPVGYNQAFLEMYTPNKDSYLSAGEKYRLSLIGKTNQVHEPAGTYAREVLNRLLIDLSWNSSRLEGNTYSLLDTERLLSLGEMAEHKTALEAQMILNHKDAIEFMVESAGEICFNRYSILNLHALLSHNLLAEPVASGRLRQKWVGIHQSVFTPLGIPQLIEKMFDLMLEKAQAIEDPFEQAFFIMVHLPYLQPFDDVNKRVSRIAANIPLNSHNLAPLSFIDVPNDLYIQGMLAVYELNEVSLLKEVFLWAYERSCNRYGAIRQSLGEPDPFRLTYRNQIRSIITQIVSQAFTMAKATSYIATEASKLPESERQKFIQAVETELMALHEGNFARYRVSPGMFTAWKEGWGKPGK